MSKRESITRYNLIIKKLRKFPASYADIADYLTLESELQSYNFITSKRTFQRDLEDIRSIYNIDIQFDYTRKVYYIDQNQQPEMNERILEAFDTFNALNISDRLSDYIHFEKRRPQGTQNLYGLLHAIKTKIQITFSYQKYWENELTVRTVEPYALKEFKNRWYLLANDTKDQKVKSFALDRMTDLEFSKQKFEPQSDYKVATHYKYCFGIISPNEPQPQEIILSFKQIQGKYIKSLPLHETQEILIDNEDELRVKLTLYLTHDFVMELLSLGNKMKILQPQKLIDEVKLNLQQALNQYNE